jgi:spermidine/putrescine transport system permease protein
VPQLVGGPADILYGNQIQTQFGNGFDWPYGSSLAILLLAILLVFLTGMRFVSAHVTRNMP